MAAARYDTSDNLLADALGTAGDDHILAAEIEYHNKLLPFFFRGLRPAGPEPEEFPFFP